MTSKNLCFKIMLEDLKRRVWVIAWSILSVVFWLAVPAALECNNFQRHEASYDALKRLEQLRSLVDMLHSNGIILVLVISAILWATSGFHYLHNRKKTDFYHSLPVKRRSLFLAVFANGILVPMICYILAEAFVAAVVMRAGAGADLIGTLPIKSVLLNGVYYCLFYSVTVLAMMMTGNIVVALLGTAVFFFYSPALSGLYHWYCETSFSTYCLAGEQEKFVEGLMHYGSPVCSYIYEVMAHDIDMNGGGFRPVVVLAVLAAAAAVAAVSYALYRIRPSEAAGKAMAFDRTKGIIKILITVPMGVAFGLFFGDLTDHSLAWEIFGTVCGAVLTHCLMEIIYHFDFRKLFARRYCLVASTCAALILTAAGYYDLYGYDSWYPKADRIREAAVYDYGGEYWITYGSPQFVESAGNSFYTWGYGSGQNWRMDNMKLTDTYLVSELARKGAQNAKASGYGAGSLIMCFRMDNGKEIYRRYELPDTPETRELTDAVFESAEYKRGIYPVLSQQPDETADVYFRQYDSGGKTPLALENEQKSALLLAYQKDLEEMTMAEKREEIPIGTIQFRTKEMDKAIRYNAEKNIKYENLDERCYYPLYPSFDRTIGVMENAGVRFMEMDESTIESIRIERYDGEDYSLNDIDVYEDPEDIRALVPGLCFGDYLNMNSQFDWRSLAGDVDVRVTYRIPLDEMDSGLVGMLDPDIPQEELFDALPTRNIECLINVDALDPDVAEKYGLKARREE